MLSLPNDQHLDPEDIHGFIEKKIDSGEKKSSKVSNVSNNSCSKTRVILLLVCVSIYSYFLGRDSTLSVGNKLFQGEVDGKLEKFSTDDSLFTDDDTFDSIEDDSASEVTPEVQTPEVQTPEVQTPEVQTPEVQTPEVQTPEVQTPEADTLEEMSEVDTPDDEKWEHWKFYDGAADIRPEGDYCSKFRNRDIPGKKLPNDAWQTDAVYVNHFINEAMNLVERAQEAILAEYGHGLPESPETLAPEQMAERRKMFEITFVELENWGDTNKGEIKESGGWMTKSSFDGLVKRLLHALMTNDSFTVVMGGHSAAAGHGNHFKQSYMMQLFHVLEPVFDRLGMKFQSLNIGRGGLGTMQDALGSKDLYGEEVDIIVWDSGMTEGDPFSYDLFARQALLGSNRAPFLWSGHLDVLKRLHKDTEADIGKYGNGMLGIPETKDENQVKTLPWATQSLKCENTRKDLCNNGDNKYRTKCWVDRPDVTPPVAQDKHIGSQVGWHPGFRTHQLTGRIMAFTILEALMDALNIWSENTIVGGHPLKDEFWHISSKYDSIQKKAKNLKYDSKDPTCEHFCDSEQEITPFPCRVCNTPLNGRTEFTPRANPSETSLLTIIRPADDGYVPQYHKEQLYDGEDVFDPSLDYLPDDAIDVRSILQARRHLQVFNHSSTKVFIKNEQHLRNLKSDIVPGKGWDMDPKMPSGNCDGSYYGICNRDKDQKCLLIGHMDQRGGVLGDSYSGWLVMDLKVKEGLVILKLQTWMGENAVPRTQGWTSENNERRRIKKQLVDFLCQDFQFDYAINGKITTLNKDEFNKKRTNPQRVVELITILDDERMAENGAEQDIEVAIRMRGCKRETTFSLTHVYWA